MPHDSVFTAFNQLPLSAEVRMTAGTATRVDPNVYISGYLAAADPAFIKRAGINRIVKLFADTDAYPGGRHRHPGVKYLVIAARDTPFYDIRAPAFEAVRFIAEGIRRNERILVQCHAGVSRSATVVLFHLMINRHYGLDLAVARLRLVRSFINPNPGFMKHLRATDARLSQLRVGDEYIDPTHRHIAPAPLYPGAPNVAAFLRENRARPSAGGEPPGALVQPLGPSPPRSPGDGVWAFSDPYEDAPEL